MGVERISTPIREDKTSSKPLYLKNLSKIWLKYPQYNESNTLIVDDSDSKMINNPKKCHFNPGTWTKENRDDRDMFKGGKLYECLASDTAEKVSIQATMEIESLVTEITKLEI